MHARLGVLAGFLVGSLGVGCGLLSVGALQSPDDPIPTGCVIKTGDLAFMNASTGSGSIAIYRTGGCSSGTTYTVRITALTMSPTESALYFRVYLNGTSLAINTQLAAQSGSQNYTLSAGTVPTSWGVQIFSTTAGVKRAEVNL